MTLRRALVASPSAVLVAVLAHVGAFGFSHAPGAARCVDLFVGLAVAFGIGIVAAFFSGVFARSATPAAERSSVFAPLLLAGAGIAAFGLIEYSEGHAVLASLFDAACAAVPLAYAVAWLTRAIASIARAAGELAGSYVRRGSRAIARSLALASRESHAYARYGLVARDRVRGRGPPLSV